MIRSAIVPSEKLNHLLPTLREYQEKAEAACKEPLIQELLKEPAHFGHRGTMTETEFVHMYGASLGSVWAALAQFGDVNAPQAKAEDHHVEEDEDQDLIQALDDKDYDGNDDDIDMDMDAGQGESRRRPYSPGSTPSPVYKRFKQVDHGPMVNSGTMQISSSPTNKGSSSDASQGTDPGFVPQGKPSKDVPEKGTVEIASAVLRYVLQACPPQNETDKNKPACLVEFSGKTSQFVGETGLGVKVKATADGELVLHHLGKGGYYLTRHCAALLEAKKRFAVVEDGVPVLSDELLGQMTCEALAFRLARSQEADAAPVDEM